MIHERFDQPAIAEEFVDGRELYVSLIGNGDDAATSCRSPRWCSTSGGPGPRSGSPPSPPSGTRTTARGRASGTSSPGRWPGATRARIEEICRTAFRALWLRDYARLDIRLAPDGEVWFLEANANPFISYGHDMANAAEKAGMDYYAFIQRLVDEAMARYGHA